MIHIARVSINRYRLYTRVRVSYIYNIRITRCARLFAVCLSGIGKQNNVEKPNLISEIFYPAAGF